MSSTEGADSGRRRNACRQHAWEEEGDCCRKKGTAVGRREEAKEGMKQRSAPLLKPFVRW